MSTEKRVFNVSPLLTKGGFEHGDEPLVERILLIYDAYMFRTGVQR